MTEATGIIGQSNEDGMPVIWRFVNELPSLEERSALPWLIVVTWRYDGSARNGMPSDQVNRAMQALEDSLEALEVPGGLSFVYCRTGNGLKEFSYYTHDTGAFMIAVNQALASSERYPIEIDFYEDAEWSEFRKLLVDFGYPQPSATGDAKHSLV